MGTVSPVAREGHLIAFARVRREVDDVFGDALERGGRPPRGGFTPRVDVFYTGEPPRAVVEIDLAGIDPDAVEIELRGRRLSIAGERHRGSAGGRLYQQVEIEHGRFHRIVDLGADPAVDRASATYDLGVLHVEIPLAEVERRARTVPVHTGPRAERPL